MSNSNLFVPRILRIKPIHADGSFTDNVVDLFFIDVPTGTPSSTLGLQFPNSDNIMPIHYNGTFPTEPYTGSTTSILLYRTSPANAPAYGAEVIQSDGEKKKLTGTPLPPKLVPRDGGIGRKRNAPSSCQDFECHPLIIQSSTNTSQFYSGGVIHFPENYYDPSYMLDTSGHLMLSVTFNNGGGNSMPAHLDFMFQSNLELNERQQVQNLPVTKFTNMYISGHSDVGCTFLDNSQNIDLYNDQNSVIKF